MLFSLFGWNWLAWLGFILALIVLFLVAVSGFNDMEESAKRKHSSDEYFAKKDKSEKLEK